LKQPTSLYRGRAEGIVVGVVIEGDVAIERHAALVWVAMRRHAALVWVAILEL
jgi:hypothetical protein